MVRTNANLIQGVANSPSAAFSEADDEHLYSRMVSWKFIMCAARRLLDQELPHVKELDNPAKRNEGNEAQREPTAAAAAHLTSQDRSNN